VVAVFTGLVEGVGRIDAVERSEDGARLKVTTELAAELAEGDSVAVNGACLTVAEVDGGWFSAEAIHETLSRTSLGALLPGAGVNLELPVRASDRLGGHLVQGHVDGVGRVADADEDGFARVVRIEADPELLRYVIEKGSIAVDGVSLTVSAVDDASFTVSLIPQTLERTTLGSVAPGTKVNLEVDVLAKYVEKLVRPR
jgi:riboflavin synthase